MNGLAPSQEKEVVSEGVCMAQKSSMPEGPTRTLPNKTISVKDLGIKVLFQPQHEDDIEIEYASNSFPRLRKVD